MVEAAPPLGILYIATILMENGVDVSIIDEAAKGFSMKDTVSWVRKEDPDILGFSTLTSSGRRAAMIAEAVKKENPNVTIVFGNFHATFNAERILKKYPSVDVIVRGEGEYTTLELAKTLDKKGDLKEVLGITFRKRDGIISTPDRPLIKDIDFIPFPNRDLLKVEYHNTTAGINVAPKKFSSFISSRGCVFKCRFCGCRRLARGLWRPRSVDNILEELHLLASEGYKQLMFVDDNFTLNPKRVIRLCQRMRQEKLDMEWICEGRVDQCSYDMIKEMVKAGCKMMYFGIESANQKVLDYYRKQITPEQAEVAVKNARKAGVSIVVGSFVLGAPNETIQDILNTLKFAEKLDLDIPQFNILEAFPGNDVWDELKMKGLLNEDQCWETGVTVPDIFSLSCKEVERIIHEGYHHFLLRPEYILRQGLRVLMNPYRFNLLINNLVRIDAIAESLRHVI
ncbi:MAG: B12-binding domain-containing radical SAM protein [Candidatus Bathyarchaeales archaeon]